MLIVTRKQEEQLRNGDHIIVTVVRLRGKRVVLGIQAPPDVPIVRQEVDAQVPPVPAAENQAEILLEAADD